MSIVTRFSRIPASSALVPERRPRRRAGTTVPLPTLPPLPAPPRWYPLRRACGVQVLVEAEEALYQLDCGHYARRPYLPGFRHTRAYCTQCGKEGFRHAPD